MRRTALIALLLGCACAKRQPAAAEKKPLPIPEDLRAKVQHSINLGREMYFQDKVASIASDVLWEHISKDQAREAGLAGYLTARETIPGQSPVARFACVFYTGEDPPRIRFEVHVPISNSEKPTFESVDPPRPAEGIMLDLVRARDAAIKAAGPYTQPLNPLVMPAGELGEKEDDILVELLAGTKTDHAVVLGKHTRVIVGQDGKVRSITPLSRGALELSTRGEQGKRLEAMYVSEVVADYPLEIHVLASRQAHLPLYVGNARGAWRVDGEHDEIVYLGPLETK